MIKGLKRVFLSPITMLLVSLTCTLLALWLTVRNMDVGEVFDALRKLPAWPFVLAFFGLVLGTFMRGLRFHILMRRTQSSLRASLEMIIIGYFFTTLLPLRAAELFRIGYFARRTGAPALSTTSAVVIERVMDLIALALLGALFLSGLAGRRFPDLPVPAWAFGVGGCACLAGVLFFGILIRRRSSEETAERSGRPAKWLGDALRGLSALGSGRDITGVFALSLGLWLVVALSMKVAFHAVDVDLSFSDAAVVLLGTSFAIALPAAPGFIGTYHLGFVGGALLVGVPREISLPVAIVFHLVIQVPFLPIGGMILFTGGRRALAKPL